MQAVVRRATCYFGDLVLLGAVVSWGGYIAASKPLVVKHGAIPVLAGTFLVGCLLAFPAAILSLPDLPPLRQVSPSAWLGVAFLGLFVTPFGWAYQNLSLRRFDASQVATFSNASPILTVLWGMWLFGETLTTSLIIGGAMTLGGIYSTCRPARPASDACGANGDDGKPTNRAAGEILPRIAAVAGGRGPRTRG